MSGQTVIPQLRIVDLVRSLAFYRDGLGFAVDWRHQFAPGMPWFAQITRQGQTLFLSEHQGDGELGGAVYFKVPDVDALYAETVGRGLRASAEAPADTDWDTREMRLTDPDGNRLRFATHHDD